MLFSTKPSIIHNWLNAKSYTGGTVHDALVTLFTGESGLSGATMTDMVDKALGKMGFTGSPHEKVRTFFIFKTEIAHPRDAERAFWSDTTYDFAITWADMAKKTWAEWADLNWGDLE